MIDARDLTTAEVRSEYALPLIQEIVEKSGLIDNAAALGIDVDGVRCDVASTTPAADAAAAPSTCVEPRAVSTLFQEIATQFPPSRLSREAGGGVGDDGGDARGSATARCYAEVSTKLLKVLASIRIVPSVFFWPFASHNRMLSLHNMLMHSCSKKLPPCVPT